MEYREIGFHELNQVVTLWNDNIGTIFPMDTKLMRQNIENDMNKKKIIGAYNEDILTGFIIFKQWTAKSGMIEPKNIYGNINSVIVDVKYRYQGIGTKLFDIAENELKAWGVRTISIGSDTFHFFPGVPSGFKTLIKLLNSRGYIVSDSQFDLICDISKVEFNKLPKMKISTDKRFRIEIFNEKDKEDLYSFFRRCFPGRWYEEIMEFFNIGMKERDLIVLKDNMSIIGFAHIYDNKSTFIGPPVYWRGLLNEDYGGLGPIGIDEGYRKQGLGLLLLYRSLEILKQRQVEKMVIDWTDLLDFYGLFNFLPWKEYKKAVKSI